MIYTSRYKSLPKERQHMAAAKLLSIGLKIEKDIDYFKEPISISQQGKPSLKNYPEVHFNVSHCKDCAAVVISEKYQVGIDIEDIKSFTPYIARKVCTLKEMDKIYSSEHPNTEFFKYWTLKESFIKAIGMGLAYKMKDVEFSEINKDDIKTNQKNCKFILIEDNEYVIGVCYKGI